MASTNSFRRTGVIFEARDFFEFARTLRSADRLVDSLDDSIRGMSGSFGSFSSGIRASLGSFGRFSSGIIRESVRVAEQVGRVAAEGLALSSSFEDAFTEVTKTVEGLADLDVEGFVQLTEAGDALKQTLIDISDQTPVLFEDLARIAGLGGQLGLAEGLDPEGTQRVLGSFSQTIAGIAEATDLTARRAALDIAQITNIFKQAEGSVLDSADAIVDSINHFGNTLVELGNTSSTTEGRILSFAQRISGTVQTVGGTQAEMLGIAAGFTSIGLTAEAGGSAVIRTLIAMQKAITATGESYVDNTAEIEDNIAKLNILEGQLETIRAKTGVTAEDVLAQRDAWLAAGNSIEDFGTQLGATERRQIFSAIQKIQDLRAEIDLLQASQGRLITGEDLQKFADVIGIGTQELKELFEEDPTEAFVQFVEGLGKAGDDAGAILKDLSLGTVQTLRALLNVSSAGDLLRGRIEASNDAWEEGTALADEIAIRYATLTSRFERFNNRLRNTVSILFDDFIPVVGSAVDFLGEFILSLREDIPPITIGIRTIIEDSASDVLREVARIFEPIQGLIDQLPTFEFDPVESFRLAVDATIEFLKGIDLTDEVAVIQGYIDTFKAEGFAGFIDTVAPNLNAVFIELDELITNITTTFDTFKTELKTPLESVDFSSVIDSSFGLLAEVLDTVNENWDIFVSGLKGVGLAFAAAGSITLIAALAGAITSLITPINLLIAASAGLVIAWDQNWFHVQDTTSLVIDAITQDFDGMQETLDNLDSPEAFREDFLGFALAIQPTIMTFKLLGDSISSMSSSLLRLGDSIATFVSGTDTSALNVLFGTIGNIIQTSVGPDVAGLVGLIDLVTDISNLVTGFFEASDEVANGLKRINTNILPLLDVDITRLTPIGDFLQQIKDSEIPSSIAQGIAGLVQPLIDLGRLAIDLDFVASFRSLFNVISDIAAINPGPLVAIADGLNSIFDVFRADAVPELDPGAIIGIGETEIDLSSLLEASSSIVSFISSITSALAEDRAQRIAEGLFTIRVALELFTGTLERIRDQDFDFTSLFNVEAADAMASFFDNINERIQQVHDSLGLGLPDASELTEFIFTVPELIQESFDGVLDGVSFGLPDTTELMEFVFTVPQQLQEVFRGLFADIEWGWPTWERVREAFQDIKDGIKETFQNIISGIFVIGDAVTGGITLGDIFGQVDGEEEGEEIARAITQGLTIGIVEREPEAEESGESFAEAFVKGFKEFFQIESPSGLMESFAKDIFDGLVLGLQNVAELNAIIDAIRLVFRQMFRDITTDMTMFSSETVPRVVDVLREDLIPTKQLLAEVNITEVIPSVDALTIAEEFLGDAFERTSGKIEDQIDKLKDFKDESAKLRPEIAKLIDAFDKLAEAIDAVGSPDITVPGATEQPPASAPTSGVPFQSGGSFTVPSSSHIPTALKGPTGGLMLEVHPDERVSITPANIVRQMSQIPEALRAMARQAPQPSPLLSGASITNQVNNQSSQNTELHLHVTESVSRDVRDSFGLMRSLAGA